MKQNRFYILIISILLVVNLNAQSVSDVVSFADEQFEDGNYSIAAQEYNRALYFGHESVDVIALQIGHCYSRMDDYELASVFYDRAYIQSKSDSLKNEAILGKSFGLLLRNKNMQALNELLYFTDQVNSTQQIQMHFLKGIASYGIQSDSAAYNEFITVVELTELSDSSKLLLDKEFKKVFKYHKKYNPTRTYIMSGLIPGSGQLSVGAIKDGLNSMALVTGLFFAALAIINNYSVLDAIITLIPWIQRYYLGGMDKAKILAEEKIVKERYKSYERIVELTSPNSYR